MFAQCKAEYMAMVKRLETVIMAQWPETLRDEGLGLWKWLDEHQPETRVIYRDLTKRLNEAWLNGIFDEFKELVLQWGRVKLEIFRGYAAYLKRMETA